MIEVGNYIYEDKENGYAYYIELYENGNYQIKLIKDYSHDFIFQVLVSKGKFDINNQSIKFSDINEELNFSANYVEKSIQFTNSYCFLKDISFRFYHQYNDEEVSSIASRSIDQGKLNQYMQCPEQKEFKPGTYDFEKVYKLNIYSEGKFEYFFEDLLVLKGEWYKKNNVIILRDEELNHEFYLLIKNKNTLISNLLPMDNYGVELKKIN